MEYKPACSRLTGSMLQPVPEEVRSGGASEVASFSCCFINPTERSTKKETEAFDQHPCEQAIVEADQTCAFGSSNLGKAGIESPTSPFSI